MQGFIVVYQHSFRSDKLKQQTLNRNQGNQLVEKYLKAFSDDDSYLDWADDPSFFCAQEMMGDIRQASWGICRRDVRNQLHPGDLVVFFCGKQNLQELKEWKYYFVGFGTVKETLSREEIWQNDKFFPYRDFYNILAHPKNGQLMQHEIIGKGHDDWRNRLKAPYIIFDSDPKCTHFNLADPLEVAVKKPDKLLEDWLDRPKVNELRNILLLQFGNKRHLRINNFRRPHRHIAIHKTEPKEKTAKLMTDLPNQLYKSIC
jgi:hypothetical protein